MNYDKSRILDIIDNRVKAVRNKDVEQATKDYSHNIILYDIVDPLERHGIESLRNRLAEWLSTLVEIRDFEIRNIDINESESVAYCTTLNHIDAVTSSGNNLDMWWRETTCYLKINGEWKITHAHSSVPFNPDNGQPSIGLKPERLK